MAQHDAKLDHILGEFEPHLELTRHWFRELFLREIEVTAPGVLSTLFSDVFMAHRALFPLDYDLVNHLSGQKEMDVFNRDFPDSTLTGDVRATAAAIHYSRNVTIEKQLSIWFGIELADELKHPGLVDLRKAVLNWSLKWGLNADWCRDRAVRQMTFEWSDEECDGYIQRWVDTGYGTRHWLKPSEEKDLVPVPNFPIWLPFYIRQDEYLRRLELKLRTVLQEDPGWSLALKHTHLKSSVNKLIQELVEDVRRNYCDTVARYYTERGYRKVNERSRIDDHINWTVRIRVLSPSPGQGATTFETIAQEAGCTPSAVRKAVREILNRLGLPMQPTFRSSRGRPKGAVDSPRSRRYLSSMS